MSHAVVVTIAKRSLPHIKITVQPQSLASRPVSTIYFDYRVDISGFHSPFLLSFPFVDLLLQSSSELVLTPSFPFL